MLSFPCVYFPIEELNARQATRPYTGRSAHSAPSARNGHAPTPRLVHRIRRSCWPHGNRIARHRQSSEAPDRPGSRKALHEERS